MLIKLSSRFCFLLDLFIIIGSQLRQFSSLYFAGIIPSRLINMTYKHSLVLKYSNVSLCLRRYMMFDDFRENQDLVLIDYNGVVFWVQIEGQSFFFTPLVGLVV